MIKLTQEKFNIFHNFISNIFNSNLNKPLNFTIHQPYYLFKFEFKLKKYDNVFEKTLSINFEFSRHYLKLYNKINYSIIFIKFGESKTTYVKYNSSTKKNNDTLYRFNLNNLNNIISKINLSFNKVDYDDVLSDTMELLKNYDIEDLVNHLEKELILH